jgi:hypothetical protein
MSHFYKSYDLHLGDTNPEPCGNMVKHVELRKKGITRWFNNLRKNLYIKNSIYFTLLVHRQEYRNEI